MDLRKAFFVLGLGACLVSATTVFAQQQPNRPAAAPGQPGANPQAGGQAARQNSDQTLATCVAIANKNEVSLAQFGKDKAESEEVKEFAAMLIKDHQALLQKLQKFTPEAASSSARSEDTTAQAGGVQPAAGTARNTAGGIQQTAGTQPAAQSGQGVDFVQLHREIGQQCLASTKKKLSEKEGKEFDQCFLGAQIGAHMGMIDKLTVFQKHTSGELQQLLADATKTTQAHLDKAEKLMKDLDDSSGKSSKSEKESK